MHRRRLVPVVLVLGLGIGALPLGCGSDRVKKPFGPGAGGGGGEAGESPQQGKGGLSLMVDGGDNFDPTLGGPCTDDGVCDDNVACTDDHCDTALGRCKFTPNDDNCNHDSYCKGAERCDVRDGCVAGEPVSCSDNSTCTIDVCVEETQSCQHDPRDADGDGDPVRNCGGQDCDDDDPRVNSGATEVCGNERDDDCDGETDEGDCSSPEYDKCDVALAVTQQGYYDIDLTATALDYPTPCGPEKKGFRDAVLQVTLPKGGPWDLDVTGKIDDGHLALATANSCGDKKSVHCESSFVSPGGSSVARLLLRGVERGTYPVYVAADSEGTPQVHVAWRAAEPAPGEYCEGAAPLTPGGAPVLFRLPGYVPDQVTACAPKLALRTGDAFATFTLDEARDVTLLAQAQNEAGIPIISLRDATCSTELTCRHSQPGRLFARNVPAGTYHVLVAATGPDDVSLQLETAPVSDAPPGEGCDAAQALAVGEEAIVDLQDHADVVNPQCLVGAPDATFQIALSGTRDVALVGRFSDGDTGQVSIAQNDCSDHKVCGVGDAPARAVRYALAEGKYKAVIESLQGNPVGLSWFERPPVAPVLVPFADDCSALLTIPETGGRFSGNTSNAFADFDAGCDVGGQSEGGAPDQMLKLSLSAPHRVILDMRGSTYKTMLSVRKGPDCPGAEVLRGCAPGYGASRSYLDLDLQAGDYFVQIDGYRGDSGAWKLDVFTAPQAESRE